MAFLAYWPTHEWRQLPREPGCARRERQHLEAEEFEVILTKAFQRFPLAMEQNKESAPILRAGRATEHSFDKRGMVHQKTRLTGSFDSDP